LRKTMNADPQFGFFLPGFVPSPRFQARGRFDR